MRLAWTTTSTPTTYGRPLTLGVPAPGHVERRPWGLLTGTRITQRGRFGMPRRHAITVATLVSATVTHEILASRDWARARRGSLHQHAGTATLTAGATAIIALIATSFLPSSWILWGSLIVLAATIAAAVLGYQWDQKLCQDATNRLFADDSDLGYVDVPLDDTTPLGKLITNLDALAVDYQRDRCDTATWQTAQTLAMVVAVDAAQGDRIDDGHHGYSTAAAYITRTRDQIGRTGRTVLTPEA